MNKEDKFILEAIEELNNLKSYLTRGKNPEYHNKEKINLIDDAILAYKHLPEYIEYLKSKT